MVANGVASEAAPAAALQAADVPAVVHKALGGIVEERGWEKPKFHIEIGSQEGDGYLSVLYRVVAENEADGDDLRLMCKTMLGALDGSLFLAHVFKAESLMYNKVLPAMEEIANMKKPLPWPRGYPNELQPPCLVMEDLRPEGFSICKRGTVLDDQHARLFVTEMARFHGAGMALDKLRPDFIAEFVRESTNLAVMEELKEKFAVFTNSGREAPLMIKDRFPEGSPVFENLKTRFESFGTDFFGYIVPDPDGGNAIVHGDAHINNVMFQRDESGAPCGCRLIDFQAVRYGWPTPDLLTNLLCVTEKPTRDKHFREWLKLYHETLQDTLCAAGIKDPDSVYSWDRFQGHLSRAAKMVVCMVPMLVFGFTEDEAIKEIQGALATMATNEEDQPPPDYQFKLKETPTLKRRFGDVVDDLVEWGWL
ncbi:uncharacterized protein LOC117645901 [Thrips palmi]|uniref:Uncharacterized protein LOC117645901 n=1 Tax=Thrips palmi TaxID=161013 RepID=A0A6P8YYK0_THRPL|nr:uncharacterized protein LOC117645901 [Thrips palmi]